MAEESAPQNLAEDLGVDTQQLKALLAQSTQKRATQMVREAEQQFAKERQLQQQQIDVLKATLEEKERQLAEEKQLAEAEKARGLELEQALTGSSQQLQAQAAQLQAQAALGATVQQFQEALSGLTKGRAELLATLQKQQDEIGELLAAQTGELDLRLRELVIPTETPRPAITPPPPVARPVVAAPAPPPAVRPAPAPVPEPQAPPAASVDSKQMNVAAVLARARDAAPTKPTPAPAPVGTSTMGMAEINEWMNGARQKKAAEPATMMMKALTPEDIQQAQAARQAPAAQPQDERRRLPRRAGNPVNVAIEAPGDPPEALQGQVFDRSQAGIGMRVGRKFEVGVILKVKAPQSPKWIEAEVRNCIRDGNSFRIGCQFAKRYAWGDIQQFG